jgi:antitoxin component of MazEF toxin-antitoxin module
MTKTISKVGNSQGIILDAALMDLARLKVGDKVNVTVIPESGAVVVMPIRKGPSQKQIKSTIRKTARDYRKTLRKLA